jgi:hypothetical protein
MIHTTAPALSFHAVPLRPAPPSTREREVVPPSVPDARLRRLAAEIYLLGPRPLYELFRELAHGAELHPTLEAYARLSPLAGFIRVHDGHRLPSLRVAGGTATSS